MDNLFINTVNVRGLGNNTKCRAMLDKLSEKCGIYFLQETHADEFSETKWKSYWSGDLFFAHGKSNAKGVAILIHNKLMVEVLEKVIDPGGRYIILKVKIENETLLLCNCYFPTKNHQKDQISLIEDLTGVLLKYVDTPFVIAGDFNIVLNPQVEKSNYDATNVDSKNFRNALLSFLETFHLEDIIRNIAPQKNIYTWHNKTKNISTRLDYIFVSELLTNYVIDYKIQSMPYTDHDLVQLKLKSFQPFPKGCGTWKFNVSLLGNSEYAKQIKETIVDSYNEVKSYEDKGFILDYIKMKMRTESIRFSKKVKAEETRLENSLIKELDRLNNCLSTSHSPETLEEIDVAKRELEKIQNIKTNGAILRSKMTNLEDGEKNSAYFLSLEKQKQKSKAIEQLKVESAVTQDHTTIMEMLHDFYSNLYKDQSSSSLPDEPFVNNAPKLSSNDQSICEGPITELECAVALKEMSNNKTPGLDGFPAEFYKFFWSDLKQILVDSFNYAFEKGELSLDQKRGLITLIPKKNKNRLLIKNWRPIALLPVDYKILAKTLANRLKKVIDKIINGDQTGYIKGRYIGENIRIIKDVITYLNVKDEAGLACLIDFEKAFDTVKWSFITQALQTFNLGPSFIKWVKVLYKNSETAVSNKGHTTRYFKPEKGVRQGCPLSAYLFIIAVELLAIKIRDSKNIKGILIDGTEIKISQLADDTTVFLKDIDSVKHLFKAMETFEKLSGLKANKDKTKFYDIGSKETPKHDTAMITIEKTPIKLLGLTITNDSSVNIEENFQPRINAITNILKHWSRRKLSLKGKITIINTLAMSQIVYPATNLDVPVEILELLHKLFYDFLWDGKRPKIAAKTLENSISEGGLKMPNIFLKVKAWQLSWLRRAVLNPESRWVLALNGVIGEVTFGHLAQSRANLNKKEMNLPNFYKQILKSWYDIRDYTNSDNIDIPDESLWYNTRITINKNEIFKKSWYKKGILFIHHILDKEGQFLSHTEISNKYNVTCNFLEILQIRMAIPLEWRVKLGSHPTMADSSSTEPKLFLALQNKFKPLKEYSSRELYILMLRRENDRHVPSSKVKWEEIYTASNLNWKAIYYNAFKICRSTKLQSFQYKILNRIIACNHWLFNIRIKNSPNCDTCKIDDSLLHFFIDCKEVKSFWNSFKQWWHRISNIPQNFSDETILLGSSNAAPIDKCFNFLLIQAKKYIYDKKLNDIHYISFYSFLHYIKNELILEKSICARNGKLNYFELTFGSVYNNL